MTPEQKPRGPVMTTREDVDLIFMKSIVHHTREIKSVQLSTFLFFKMPLLPASRCLLWDLIGQLLNMPYHLAGKLRITTLC